VSGVRIQAGCGQAAADGAGYRRAARVFGLVLFGACLVGCHAVGPDFTGPPSTTADEAKTFPAATPARHSSTGPAPGFRADDPPAAWWALVKDPVLDSLIADAQRANYDLRIAAANVAAARALLDQTLTRRLPNLDANGAVVERRNASALFPGGRADKALPTTLFGTFGFDLTWEIDLFGRVQRSIEAAEAELGSNEALRQGVMVSVLAGVARAYIDLRGTQTRLDVAARNVRVQEQTLALVNLLNREGAATELDVARARTQLLASQATIPRLEAQRQAALNRLTTLTARPPGALDARLLTPRPLPAVPAFVATGDPAGMVRRRPDILAAEHALAGATALIGVATADLFPTVRFGALGGVGAAQLSNLGAPGAPFMTIGPTLVWNLFDRRAIYARIRAADSSADAALARYEQTVTRALEEVDSALSAYASELQRQQQLSSAHASSEEASRLANLRYREGVEDFLAVLDAERSQLEIEDQFAQSRIAVGQFLVDIHLALGGGWEAALQQP
jgi:multidrug efflux system outer membrane protein